MHSVAFGSLPNGIRTVVIHRPHLHRAVVTALVGVGSRYETPNNNGLSHLLEHMLFRGTAKHSDAHALNDAIERLGGDLIATTHADYSTYEISVPPDAVGRACSLVGAMLCTPAMGQLEVEKAIVREEILENLDDNLRLLDPDSLSRQQLFSSHPLGLPITGTIANVDRFTERHLRAHHEHYYVGGNVVVAVCSPHKPKRVQSLIAQGFGALAGGDARVPSPARVKQRRARIEYAPRMGSQTCVRLAFATPGESTEMARAIEILARVLHDGMSTRLHRRICDELGLAYDVSAGLELFRDVGVFDVGASVAHESVPRLVREVLTMLGDLALEGPTEAEVEKAVRRYAFELDALADDPHALAKEYGSSALWGRRLELDHVRESLASINVSAVRRAARVVFTPMRLNLTLVGDLSREELGATRAAARAFRERFSRALCTGAWRPPARVLVRPAAARAALTAEWKG
ncbi:MAG: pitrilysin family protein [Polyangiales bacterium]